VLANHWQLFPLQAGIMKPCIWPQEVIERIICGKYDLRGTKIGQNMKGKFLAGPTLYQSYNMKFGPLQKL